MINVDNIKRSNEAKSYANKAATSGNINYAQHGLAASEAARKAMVPTYNTNEYIQNQNISKGATNAARAAAMAPERLDGLKVTARKEAIDEAFKNPGTLTPQKLNENLNEKLNEIENLQLYGPAFLKPNYDPETYFNEMSAHNDLYD